MTTTFSHPSRNAHLIPLGLCILLGSLGTSIANVALPALSEAFAAPFPAVQGVIIAYLGALTLLSVLAGRLGDVHGLGRVLSFGLGLFWLASLACGLAPNLWLLIMARAVQGAAAAVLMTLALALARETAGEDRVGRTMGLLGTISALGMAAGPSLGGLLLATIGWRSLFIVLVPLGMLAQILVLRLLPGHVIRREPLPKTSRALHDRALLAGFAGNLLVAMVMMTTLVAGPFYLSLALGLDAVSVGLVMAIGPVISIATGVPSGHAVDAWGAGRVLGLGLALLCTGAFGLAALPQLWGTGGYVFGIAVLTPGYQLFQAANNTLVLTGITRDQRGTISGFLNLSRNLGLTLGASAMGAVFAIGVGSSNLGAAGTSAINDGMRLVFTVAGLLMVLALILTRARKRNA